MPDSEALRTRRRRQHAAGDHSLCTTRCDAVAAEAAQDAEPVTDPPAKMAELAGRLVAAHTADPGNAMLARELRQTLLAMDGQDAPPVDDVDRIRSEWEAGT
jgi:hypothetical protein